MREGVARSTRASGTRRRALAPVTTVSRAEPGPERAGRASRGPRRTREGHGTGVACAHHRHCDLGGRGHWPAGSANRAKHPQRARRPARCFTFSANQFAFQIGHEPHPDRLKHLLGARCASAATATWLWTAHVCMERLPSGSDVLIARQTFSGARSQDVNDVLMSNQAGVEVTPRSLPCAGHRLGPDKE